MYCRLIIRDGRKEKILELKDQPILVGRGEECTIPLSDPKCSRRQCEITPIEGGYKLVDLESRNGTKVNDDVVNQKLLTHGDIIRIGEIAILFDDPMRDPGRKIPGRLSDYKGVEPPKPVAAPGLNIQPGPVELAPPKRASQRFQPLPSIRKTTEKVRREVYSRQTEDVPMSRNDAREIRREKEEQSVIRTVSIIVGVFFGLFVLFFVIGSLTGKPPERRAADSNYIHAVDKFREAQAEPDLKVSILKAEEALRLLRGISQEAGSVYANAQVKAGEIQEFIAQKDALTHRDEALALEALAETAGRVRSGREVEAALQEIAAFRDRFPEALAESHQRVDQIEAALKAKRGTTHQQDFEEMQEAVDDLISKARFPEALAEADRAMERFHADFDLQQKSVNLREHVLGRVGNYVRERLNRAREYRDRRDADAARHVYDEILASLGNGDVPDFRAYEELVHKERARE